MAKRILAVDDSATMRQLVKMTLSRSGYEVVEADDGSTALVKASAETFDMVLSDINMPIMSGLDLVRNLRKLAQYKFTPIVLVTTESQVEKKQEGKGDRVSVSVYISNRVRFHSSQEITI